MFSYMFSLHEHFARGFRRIDYMLILIQITIAFVTHGYLSIPLVNLPIKTQITFKKISSMSYFIANKD